LGDVFQKKGKLIIGRGKIRESGGRRIVEKGTADFQEYSDLSAPGPREAEWKGVTIL